MSIRDFENTNIHGNIESHMHVQSCVYVQGYVHDE